MSQLRISDFDLVRRVCIGDKNSFSDLITRYQDSLIHISIRYVGDRALAEDIVQESFMKAFEKLTTFQFRSSFKSWLYRIAINTAKNSLRSKKTTVELSQVALSYDATCESDLVDRDLLEQACQLIEGLPPKQQEAIRLRVFEDMSFHEVAQELDCPYDTAKANYRHGLLKLQEKMVLVW